MVRRARPTLIAAAVAFLGASALAVSQSASQIGQERAIAEHLADGQEFTLEPSELVEYGRRVFTAQWTTQDGVGRPLTNGLGRGLVNPSKPLTAARSFNRVSGPDANACGGCHNMPFSIAGGSGDFVSDVFQLAQRFDFATFDQSDRRARSGTVDERGKPTSLQTIGNLQSTPGLFGAGYLEMLARQMTLDLQAIRDTLKPGQTTALISKGISFGRLGRRADGTWDTSAVQGLPAPSLRSIRSSDKPSLVIHPWHQSGSSVSLREFTNTTFNQHHGMQSTERFGHDTDPDGDGVMNELTRADLTATVVFQATLQVPGRVIPNDPVIERGVLRGEQVFSDLRCGTCHVPVLPLDRRGWIYIEPGPFNPPGTLRAGEAPTVEVDLTDPRLPMPRLSASARGVVQVPAYTDFKLHDITDASDPSASEPLDMNQTPGSAAFFAGNRRFLTKRLWGVASQPTHFHHGLLTTLRQSVLAHAGEALAQRQAFTHLPPADQNALVEFLKTLQVLPPGTPTLVVDEHYRPRAWPPAATRVSGRR